MRSLVRVRPLKHRHEIRSFECPQFSTVFRLLVQRETRPAADEVHDRPLAAAAAQSFSTDARLDPCRPIAHCVKGYLVPNISTSIAVHSLREAELVWIAGRASPTRR